MKLGVFLMPKQPRTDDPVRRFRECLEQTQLARDAGFDAVAAGHHYVLPPYQALQNLPLLARLAGETGSMDLVLSIVLLALLNPVQVAEDVATLDIMSEGRVVFGIGLGYREVEYEAFGVARRDGVPRMLAALELLKRLWTEDGVTHEGPFFRLHGATCTIRPVQKPFPPVWIAANADAAVARAARLGYAWYANPHASLATIERQWRLYKETLAGSGHALPLGGRSRSSATWRRLARRRSTPRGRSSRRHAAYADWGQDKVLPGDESFRIGFEKLARDRFLLGTAEDVIEQLEARVTRLESNYFILRVSWPGSVS